MSGRKRKKGGNFLTNTVLLVAAFAALAWAFIPGIGPDLGGLSQRWDELGLPRLDRIFSPDPAAELANAPQTDLIQALRALPVAANRPQVAYRRGEFGQAWADTDANGCDTRNDILRRDLKNVALKPGTRGCVVLSGDLLDPYTGAPLHFQRGPKTSEALQIDHVVALADAWRSGAWQWELKRREAFANDPLVLLAVSGEANQDKGAAGADTWLPPNRGFHCAYIARQVAIKHKYGLSVTEAEQRALARIALGCPGQSLPR